MPLQFEVFDEESGAFSYPDDCYDGMMAEFDGLVDAHDAGELNDTRYLAALNRLLAEAPRFRRCIRPHCIPLAPKWQTEEGS